MPHFLDDELDGFEDGFEDDELGFEDDDEGEGVGFDLIPGCVALPPRSGVTPLTVPA